MSLIVSEIKDFIRCPEYYSLRWIDNTPELSTTLSRMTRTCSLAVAEQYFAVWARDGVSPGEGWISNRWQEVWMEPMAMTSSGIVVAPSTREKESAVSTAKRNLEEMVHYFSSIDFKLVATQSQYSIPLSLGESISGKFDIHAKLNGRPSFIKLTHYSSAVQGLQGGNEIELTLWKHIIGDTGDLYYYVLDGQPKDKLLKVDRSPLQVEEALATAETVAAAIKNKQRYKRYSWLCTHCRYMSRCNLNPRGVQHGS
jgi:hypothetical protein